jgi:hypothetical protein
MTQSPGEPQPLDLYGEKRVVLHRPRLAAAACCMFAAGEFLFFCWNMFRYQSAVTGLVPGRAVIFHAQMAQYVGQIVLYCMGIVLIGMADVAGGEVDPAPRRGLVITGGIACCLICVAQMAVWTHPPASIALGSVAYFFTAYFGMMTAGEIFMVAAHACGLLYAAQVAGWVRSRALRNASIAILGLSLFRHGLQATAMGLFTAYYMGKFSHLADIDRMVAWSLDIFETLSGICTMAYFIVLARRLAKRHAAT